jgi:hypothetical protein
LIALHGCPSEQRSLHHKLLDQKFYWAIIVAHIVMQREVHLTSLRNPNMKGRRARRRQILDFLGGRALRGRAAAISGVEPSIA